MPMREAAGFDTARYLQEQTIAILDRVDGFGKKLNLEFGEIGLVELPPLTLFLGRRSGGWHRLRLRRA